MKRFLIIVTLGFASLAHSADTKPKRYVNVGDPEAMKQFAESAPEVAAKARRLLCEIDYRSPRGEDEWARAKFGAERLIHSTMMTASEPPKRSISFVIGETSFAGTYELGQWGRCAAAD